jgi:predicted NBD/HSP70 family sugar kinase
MNVLVIDVGGSHVKCLATGQTGPRVFDSGKLLTPQLMVEKVGALVADLSFDAISIGYPGPVSRGLLAAEPHNLGSGWVGFDFAAAFGKPVKVINDAAMQALGSYNGGHMLFIGLGTGLGSAMVMDGVVHPLELAHLPFRRWSTYEDEVGERGLERMGKRRWRKRVALILDLFYHGLLPDYIVVGGGNARKLEELPEYAVPGNNANAFRGGFLLWNAEAPPLAAGVRPGAASAASTA